MKAYGSKRQDRGRGCRCCPDKAGKWCKSRERQRARLSLDTDPAEATVRLTYASAWWEDWDGEPVGPEHLWLEPVTPAAAWERWA